MEEIATGEITVAGGLAGDSKGIKYPRRQITVLAAEDWAAAIAELADLAGPVPLPWTARRANLLVSGIRLPRSRGSEIEIGAVRLEVTGQTFPCVRMEEAHRGLLKALAPAWRGGVTCRVLVGGRVVPGDAVTVVRAVGEHVVRLPG
jgi:MOSC domain-containing protein YiiM